MKDSAQRMVSRLDLAHHWSLGRGRRSRLIGSLAAVKLLVDAEQFMPVIVGAFSRAKRQILIEMYMIASDATGMHVIDVLCDKARQGVKVWVVFDAIGSMHLSTADSKRLVEAGARLRIFNRLRLLRPFHSIFRTHRRIIVVDGEVGFVGGFGFSDEWTTPGYHDGPWHELAWQVTGAPLREMADIFSRNWQDLQPVKLPVQDVTGGCAYRIMNKASFGTTVLRRTIIRRIRRASKRIWITTGYFVPGLLLRRAMMRAAQRGVDVRLMLTGPTDHQIVRYAGRRHYRPLLGAGVKIYETRSRMLHAKSAIIDDDLAAVGSSNLDNWSLRYNKEFNLAVASTAACDELARAMTDIQQHSTEITLDAWLRRPWTNRLLERLFGMADDLL